jgi:hypothetical protein
MRYVLMAVLVMGCGVPGVTADGGVATDGSSAADLLSRAKEDGSTLSGEDFAGLDFSAPADLTLPSDFAGCSEARVACAPGQCCPGLGCHPLGGNGPEVCCKPNGQACAINGECCGHALTTIECGVGGTCCIPAMTKCDVAGATCCAGLTCKPAPGGTMECAP